MRLGPSGYPFEKFVAELLRAQGYKVQVGKVVSGFCVKHEVDVIARKDDRHILVECKFHSSAKIRSDVKTTLYIKSRVDDIISALNRSERKTEKHEGWIVTNTRFTHEAVRYAWCVGLRLISWDYPKGDSLMTWINKTGLHPISALTYLNNKQKEKLTQMGMVLCRDVAKKKHLLRRAGIHGKKLERVVREAEAVCQLQNTL